MKKMIAVLLLLCILSGCGKLVDDTYYVTEKHSEQSTQNTESVNETDEPTVVSNRNDLRAAVLYRTRNWIEQDVLLIKNYDGDFNQDLSEVLHHATQEDPIGAYAVDYIDVQLLGDTVSGSIQVSIVFRRSAAEINSIVTVNGTTNALRRVQLALLSYETSLTLRIRNYQEVNFEERIHDYCLRNLDKVLALPELSAEVYPDSGETRILELHFTYPKTREEMRLMLSSVNTTLTSAASYVNSGKNDPERLELLTRFLTTRFDYQISEAEPIMPAYELLHDGLAHSLSFAAVFRYECTAANMECWLVSGMKEDQPYYWNIVCIDDVYYHVDLMRNVAQENDALVLLTAQELRSEGYVWEMEAYPFTPETDIEPIEPSAEHTQPTQEPTEAVSETTQQETEPTEPTEDSTAETEPTEESIVETEPTEAEENN